LTEETGSQLADALAKATAERDREKLISATQPLLDAMTEDERDTAEKVATYNRMTVYDYIHWKSRL
jgi:hypothetical protein